MCGRRRRSLRPQSAPAFMPRPSRAGCGAHPPNPRMHLRTSPTSPLSSGRARSPLIRTRSPTANTASSLSGSCSLRPPRIAPFPASLPSSPFPFLPPPPLFPFFLLLRAGIAEARRRSALRTRARGEPLLRGTRAGWRCVRARGESRCCAPRVRAGGAYARDRGHGGGARGGDQIGFGGEESSSSSRSSSSQHHQQHCRSSSSR